MTKARDLSSLISSSGQIDNTKITLDANEIPNLDTSKITTGTFDASKIGSGTFADARISSSSVSQHAESFDDNKIVNDISTLGLRVHTQENLTASNTSSASFDTFQDSSGITNLTNASRNSSEYVASSVSVPATEVLMKFEETSGSFVNDGIGAQSGQTLTIPNALSTTTNSKFGSRALHVNQATGRSVKLTGTNLITSSSDFTVEFFQNNNGLPSGIQDYTSYWEIQTSTTGGTHLAGLQLRANFAPENTRVYWTGGNYLDIGSANDTTWRHHAYSRVNGTTSYWYEGTRQFSFSDTQVYNGVSIGNKVSDDTNDRFIQYVDDVLICTTVGKYDPTQSSITVPTSTLTGLNGSSVSATGSFEGNPITASSTNKMGAVITYQDQAGTNVLNTDIILKLSADNGSNYTTATLTALPDFATGIKMCKVNDLSVTAGTQLKYKIEFANQSASKEARIRGVSLQY